MALCPSPASDSSGLAPRATLKTEEGGSPGRLRPGRDRRWLGRLAGRRILVVEDDLKLQKVARKAPERSGATVSMAADVHGAVRLLSHEAFDLVLTDYHLGTRKGIELARWLAGTKPRLPVILVSGDLPATALTEARTLGCTILEKPVDSDELVVILAEKLER